MWLGQTEVPVLLFTEKDRWTLRTLNEIKNSRDDQQLPTHRDLNDLIR